MPDRKAALMKTKLKQFRVRAVLTQAKLAKKVGVSQPTYQRWESGAAPIPEAKLNKLAEVLGATPEALLGRHPPVQAALYDDSARDDISYYGEVAVHFSGGGAPLLLSISEETFAAMYRDLQLAGDFVTAKSLANQMVAIRTKAVSDLYFSSEAYDDYGPEHSTYTDSSLLQLPDPRDWEIIEALEDETGLEDFDPTDVERVRKMIMITDEQYTELVKAGRIKAKELESERETNQRNTENMFKLASTTTYQLSCGKQRGVVVYENEAIYNAFYALFEFEQSDQADEMILLPVEGRHRTIFINKIALDYVSIPAHKYEAGRVEVEAAALEHLEDITRR